MWFQYSLLNELGESFNGSINYVYCKGFVTTSNTNSSKSTLYYLIGECIYFVTSHQDSMKSVYAAFQSALNGVDTNLGQLGYVAALKTKSA